MPDRPPPDTRLVTAGLACLAVGAWASIWHFFASQSPSSPLHVGFLPGPIQRFAFWSLALGAVLPVLARVLPEVDARPGRLGRWLLVGTSLKVAGLALGAFWSVYGIQIIDPRPKSVVVMALRLFGAGILAVTLTRIAWRWARRSRQPS